MNGIDYKKSLAQKEKNKEAVLKFCLLPKIQTKQFFFSFGFGNSKWVAQ